jgi:hypothetical protein
MNIMNLVAVLMQFIGILVVPFAAGVVLGRTALGRRSTTKAACAACRTAVDRSVVVAQTACPQCTAPIDDAHPPVPLTEPRSGWLRAACIAAILLGPLVGIATAWSVRAVSPGAMAAPAPRPTNALFAAALSRQEYLGDDLALLRARERDGEDVVGTARLLVAGALGGTATTGGTPRAATSLLEVAAIALLGLPGGRPVEPDADLAAAVLARGFPQRAIDVQALRANGGLLRPSSTGFVDPGGPLRQIAVVRAARIDGRPVELRRMDRLPGSEFVEYAPLLLEGGLPSGATRLEIDLEVRLYSAFDADRRLDHRGALRPFDLWPAPLASTTTTLEARLDGGG